MKYFSLFSGIGGFEYGIEKVFIKPHKSQHQKKNTERKVGVDIRWDRFKTGNIGYSEINKYATAIYRYHYSEHKNYGDARKIVWEEVNDFDMLIAGFPCQSFSVAGKRKGFNDTRGSLFFEICRALQIKRPRLFLLENVRGLLSCDEGSTFLVILQSLDELGYDCQWQVLNSKNYGIPQNRERVFIVGHTRGTPRPEIFPIREGNKNDTRQSSIHRRNLISRAITGGYGDVSGHSTKIADYRNDDGLRVRKESISPCLAQRRHSETDISTMPPLTIEDMKIRRLTPIECERLQGFPDSYTRYGLDKQNNKIEISDTQRYKCLGNAVTTTVIEAIMERLV